MRAGILAAALALLPGCTCSTDVFQRMEAQPKYLPYQESGLFEDGRAMRAPPEGTVPREVLKRSPLPAGGKTPEGAVITRIPLAVTAEVMARGQKRFDIYCATCHGLLGDGDSMVARNMSVRPPPSLHDFAGKPVGWYFDVITQGYGLMPSYRQELSTEDRWAVVAYLLALQRSQRTPLEQAPPEARARLSGGTR
ncbi:MAG TPA: cytochrome c [Myxococcaceae bacterium]|jgi:mono/diheme cytochrome c family protein